MTGLLVLTHNISALNFMPFVALYLVLGVLRGGQSQANQLIARAGRSGERPCAGLRLFQTGWMRPMLVGGLALRMVVIFAAQM